MARSSKDVWVQFRGRTQDLDRATQTAGDRLEALGRRGERIGRTLTTRVTLPILAVGTAALLTSATFQSSMNRVQAVSGATAAEFQNLSRQSKDLGATTQFSASQAAEAQAFLAQAGFRANQILGAMPSTLQLAAAAQLDLATAADISSNVLSGYRMEVGELAGANDVLVKAFTSANTNLEQLGEAMKLAGPVARGANMEFSETVAILGQMGNAGFQGSMAGTALRGALSRLLNPTAEITKRLKDLQVSTRDSSGQLLSMVDIMAQLEARGATTEDMMILFGQRAGPALSAVLGQGTAALSRLRQELRDSGGTAKEIADVQMRGVTGALKEMKSAVEALFLAFTGGEPMEVIEASTRRVAVAVRSLAAAVDAVPGPLRAVNAAMFVLIATTGPAVAGVAAFARVMGTLRNASAAAAVILAPKAMLAAGLIGIASLLYGVARAGREAQQVITGIRDQMAGDVAGLSLEDVDRRLSGIRQERDEVMAYLQERLALQERLQANQAAGQRVSGLNTLAGEIREARDRAGELLVEFQELQRHRERLLASAPPSGEGGETGGVGDEILAIHQNLADALRVAQGLSESLPDFDLEAAQASAYRTAIENLLKQGLEPTDQAVVRYSAHLLELTRAQQATTEAGRAQAEMLRLVDAAVEASLDPFQRLSSQVQMLLTAMEMFPERAAEIARAIAHMIKQFNEQNEEVVKSRTWHEDWAQTVGASVGQVSLDFQSWARSVINSIAQVTARLLVFRALMAVFSPFAGGDGVRAALFNTFSAPFGGARAAGGPIMPGKVYLARERGPELIMPRSAGQVHSASATRQMLGGGGGTITLDFANYPAPRTPLDSVRDGEIQRWLREALDVAVSQGYKPRFS